MGHQQGASARHCLYFHSVWVREIENICSGKASCFQTYINHQWLSWWNQAFSETLNAHSFLNPITVCWMSLNVSSRCAQKQTIRGTHFPREDKNLQVVSGEYNRLFPHCEVSTQLQQNLNITNPLTQRWFFTNPPFRLIDPEEQSTMSHTDVLSASPQWSSAVFCTTARLYTRARLAACCHSSQERDRNGPIIKDVWGLFSLCKHLLKPILGNTKGIQG